MQGISSPSSPMPSPAGARGGAPHGATPNAGAPNPAPVKRKFRHTVWWYLKWFFTILTLVLFFVTGVTVSIGYGLYQRMGEIVPDVRSIETRNKAEPTKVFSANGEVLAEFKGEQRFWIALKDLQVQRQWQGKKFSRPARIIDATIAIEDARFYSHPGMDPKRILKAAWINFRSGDVEQGGSTITEQLAKNVYLSRARTYSRRLNTALLALQLEKKFSKDEIIELYLNEIFYGNNAYGCEAAAQRYFGRHARELNIQQAAMLAGLPQSPTRLDPFAHYDNAIERQRLVLRAMLRNKKISYTEYLKAVRDKGIKDQITKNKRRYLEERREVDKWRSPYFVSYVRQYLKDKYNWTDEFLSKSGLKIYTTLDPKMQGLANEVMTERLNNLGGSELQGALVCIDPTTGHVLAMYGGRDYYGGKRGQWNRATQAKRQPGSTFKPYVYATALEEGYGPRSRVRDSRLVLGREYGRHEVKNYDYIHRGIITFREALGMSNNVAATRVLMKVGFDKVIQKAHMMGIESTLKPLPALALGASDVTLLEHTSAFGVFATRGLRAEPTPIERVLNGSGEVLIEHAHPVRAARVLGEPAANGMWDMLRYVMTSGTGQPAQIPGVESIGKTGTTSNTKDVWFLGATKELVTGVWIGYDKPRYMNSASGGRWCGPAWRTFMRQALKIQDTRDPIRRLVEDERATSLQRQKAIQSKRFVRVLLCEESGLIATSQCTDSHVEEFSAAQGAPSQVCTIHSPRARERRLGDDRPPSSDEGEPGDDPARRDFNNDLNDLPPEAGTLESDDGATEDDGGQTADDGLEERGAWRNDNRRLAALAYREAERRFAAERLAERRLESQRRSTSSLALVALPQMTDNNEVAATVCADSGQLARRTCPVTMQRFFTLAAVPRRPCSLHG